MLKYGLNDILQSIKTVDFTMSNGDQIELKILNIHLENPCVPDKTIAKTRKIYPAECRQRKISYSGMLSIQIGWSVNGIAKQPIDRDLGLIPIMLKVCLKIIF